MIVKQFSTGGDRNFGYLIADDKTRQAVVVDPSYSPDKIVKYADENNFKIVYVFYTHDHFDHTNGNETIKRLTGCEPLGYGSVEPTTGIKIIEMARLSLGELSIKVFHTPGHTQDSICILIDDAVFTGDTLFVGKVGGTDYGEQAWQEYNSLHKKLMSLPDETKVYPGHDYGTAPESTIKHEKETNPFIIQKDFDAFVNLKKNWLDYKREHGIK